MSGVREALYQAHLALGPCSCPHPRHRDDDGPTCSGDCAAALVLIEWHKAFDAEQPKATKVKICLDDPETRAVWQTAKDASAEVAAWPAWKRGESSSSSDEVAWLIERVAPPGCEWWTGDVWSRESLDAVRFARKLDALRVITRLHLGPAFATEHMWCGK